MQAIIPIIIIGVISGAAIGLQGPMASIITHKLGILESVFIIHFGGAIIALVPLLLIQKGGNLSQWRDLPWYVFLAGVFGLVVFAAVSYLIPRVGVAPAMMLIILGQVVIGVILDHYGMLGAAVRQFSVLKLAGILIMLAGAWLTIRS